MNWIVTGGYGFIGTNLIRSLIKNKKNKILIIDKKKISYEKISNRFSLKKKYFCKVKISDFKWKKKINILEKDILKCKFTEEKFGKPNYIIHLAANPGVEKSVLKPYEDARQNILTTIKLIEYSRDIKLDKFIFISSAAVTGRTKGKVGELSSFNYTSPYGLSKATSEKYCELSSKLYNLKIIVLRMSNIYGDWSENKSSVIAKFIKLIEKNKKIQINGNGEQTRDFIHVSDVVLAIKRSINFSKKKFFIFNITSGKNTKINKLLNIFDSIYKNNFKKKIEYEFVKRSNFDIDGNLTPNLLAKKYLKINFQTDLYSGIKKTILYFKNM